ncbi:MAG: V-type ATP synthase subunit E family protein [Eubacteriales bacterium]
MNGIENITARIGDDSKAELAKILADAQAEMDTIKAEATAAAQKETEEILARGKIQAAERKSRLISGAHMEERKLELGLKQEMLTKSFDLALEKLCTRSQGDYAELLASFALAAMTTGEEVLIFSAKDKDSVGPQVIAKVNEAIAKGKAPELPDSLADSKAGPLLEKLVQKATELFTATNLTIADETREMPSGFIMMDGDVEINCGFDTLVRLQRNHLELEVADLLFGN